MKSLRAKLRLNMVLAGISLFLLGGVGFYLVFLHIHEAAAGAGMYRLLQAQIGQVDEYFNERQREFNAYAERMPGSSELIGTGICNASSTQRLSFVRDPGWERIAVVDTRGHFCAGTNDDQGIYPEETAAISSSLGGARPASDFEVLGFSGDLVSIYSAPLLAPDGRVYGVLLGRLGVSRVQGSMEELGVPAQLLAPNGLLIASSRSSDAASVGHILTDNLSLRRVSNALSLGSYGTLSDLSTPVLVASAIDSGSGVVALHGWQLVAAEPLGLWSGGGLAFLGGVLFGLLALFCGLLFFSYFSLRLIREFDRVGLYARQQLKGVTEYVPRDQEIEISEVYAAIGKLAMRYNVLSRARDDAAISLTQDLEGLRAERDRFAVILSSMREGVCVVSGDGKVETCNLAAAEMAGLPRERIEHFPYLGALALFLDPECARPSDVIARGLKSGGMTAEEGPYYLRRPDGGTLPVRLQCSTIRHGAERAAVGVLVMLRDVRHELAVEQAKSEFVSITSHQMRTPLATMRWHIERLLKPGAHPLSTTAREYLGRIERNNRRMIKLTDALLDVSRIDLGLASERNGPIDLRAMLKEVLDEIDEETIKERTITSGLDGLPRGGLVGDPYLVRVILENFIENAINYSRKGGHVDVVAALEDDVLGIDVHDDGIGIAPEMKDKVFLKFSRGKEATEAAPAGTGLGLYITKSLVERAGGRIWFTSDKAEGTVFSARLPLASNEKQHATDKK